jgi:hypothetical protein
MRNDRRGVWQGAESHFNRLDLGAGGDTLVTMLCYKRAISGYWSKNFARLRLVGAGLALPLHFVSGGVCEEIGAGQAQPLPDALCYSEFGFELRLAYRGTRRQSVV